MTIKSYITSKFQPFGIKLSEADLADMEIQGVDVNNELTSDNRSAVFTALVRTVIPQFMLRAKSVSESGFSISYDTDALKDYYAWLCKELGIEDNLNEKSSITDASELW